MKKLIVLIVGLLPSSGLKVHLLRRAGFHIDSTVEINPCIIWNVGSFSAGPNSRIGFLSVFRDLRVVRMGAGARVGQLNWISAAPDLCGSSGDGVFELGDHSALTNRHYLDCSGGIVVMDHTTIAGVRSTFITHGIDWRSSTQEVSGIRIGAYCLISSNVCLTPGANVPSRTVVGMGATVDRRLNAAGLAVAPRAATVKSSLTGSYFSRQTGFVGKAGDSEALPPLYREP